MRIEVSQLLDDLFNMHLYNENDLILGVTFDKYRVDGDGNAWFLLNDMHVAVLQDNLLKSFLDALEQAQQKYNARGK